MDLGSPPEGETRSARRRGALGLAACCAACFLLKLWLVAADELVALPNPLDQLRFLETARSLILSGSFGAYDHTTLAREPAYPIWLALVHATGVPARTAVELLLAAAALTFVAALRRVGLPRALAGGAFAVLILQPHSLVVGRDAVPAGLYLALLLLGLAGVTWAGAASTRSRRAVHSIWAGLALGALACTRPEKLLAAVPIVAAAVVGCAACRAHSGSFGLAARRTLVPLVVACAGFFGVGALAAAHHHAEYGLFATSEQSAPGYRAAVRALLSVEHAAPRRFVPVPSEVRQRAYAVSPAFRALAPHLERDGWARHASCRTVRVCDDYGAGHFFWNLREAAAEAGRTPSAGAAESFYRRMAGELVAACERGDLACQRTLAPQLHPYVRTYAAHLGGSLSRLARRFASAGDPASVELSGDSPSTPPGARRLYDFVANRRRALTTNGRAVVEGFVVSPGDPVAAVELHAGDRPFGHAPNLAPPAVEGAPYALRFDFEKPRRSLAALEPTLVVALRSGARATLPLPLTPGEARDGGVRVEIERIDDSRPEDLWRRRVREGLWQLHAVLVLGATAIGGVAAVIWLVPPWRGRRWDPALGVCVATATGVVARIAMLALLDASAHPAHSSRYIYPAVSLYSCSAGMWAVLAWRRLRGSAGGASNRTAAAGAPERGGGPIG